ncbi:MAG: PIN domain-containing protein [Nitrososphaerales archaeon]
MILDTTYLLPLARIDVETDLLLAIAEKDISTDLRLEQIKINSISIFELQAKAAKLGVKPEYVLNAIEAITKSFKVESYYSPTIIKTAGGLRKTLFSDYIDCIIVATAIQVKEKLVTEDSRIVKKRGALKDRHNLEVITYRELLNSQIQE